MITSVVAVQVVFVPRVTVGLIRGVPIFPCLLSIFPDEKLCYDGAGEESSPDAGEDGGHHHGGDDRAGGDLHCAHCSRHHTSGSGSSSSSSSSSTCSCSSSPSHGTVAGGGERSERSEGFYQSAELGQNRGGEAGAGEPGQATHSEALR